MIILYPTETIYGLGVDPFDTASLAALYELKDREAQKAVTWLVRTMEDVGRYAEISGTAARLAERFLPGPLTLVLPAKSDALPPHLQHLETIGFRISSDPVAQKLIADFMEAHDAPLTCTSANIAGMPTCASVPEILAQFGEKGSMIDIVHDDGPRTGAPSTIVRVVGDAVECVREGAYPMDAILQACA